MSHQQHDGQQEDDVCIPNRSGLEIASWVTGTLEAVIPPRPLEAASAPTDFLTRIFLKAK